MAKTVRILGTRGIPAAYGGFETAAENVARYLVAHGWRVVVYCQGEGSGAIHEDVWEGIELVTIPERNDGSFGTARFDLRAMRHAAPRAARDGDVCLTFGYNTAVLNTWLRLRGIPNVINMDGIEWSRARWDAWRKGFLWSNERIGCRVGDVLIADNPEIAAYLAGHAAKHKIRTIAYGAPAILDAPTAPVLERGLQPGRYVTLIARPVPENSLLELVTAFSRRPRGHRLAVVGKVGTDEAYHRAVREAAGDEVDFFGGIYDTSALAALRFHSAAYLHGHTVGGTNPSLVEALGAGNAVLAHDNPYNRWTAGDAGLYFRSVDEADDALARLFDDETLRKQLGQNARQRHAQEFTWDRVAGQYADLLADALKAP